MRCRELFEGPDGVFGKDSSKLVKLGATCGLSSAMVVTLLGQSRVFFSMSRDGLLPKWACAVHPRFRTPYISTIFVGVRVAVVAALTPINVISELVSIGTLLAFVIVCSGVWILRRRGTEVPRAFVAPWIPFTPIMGIAVSLLMLVFSKLLFHVERPNGIENLSISLVSCDVRAREFHCSRKWAQYNAVLASLEGSLRGDLEKSRRDFFDLSWRLILQEI
jgi:amino acid transporter